MTLDYEYFPVVTFILLVFVGYSLYRGYKKGFFFSILNLASVLAAVFLAWPAGRALAAAYPIFFTDGTSTWVIDHAGKWAEVIVSSGVLEYFNTVIWFLIVGFVLRLLTALVYKATKWLHKIRIIGFFDQLFGLLLSCVTTLIWLSVLVMFLELPIVTNGPAYVENSPLRYVKTILEEDFPYLVEEFYA